MTSGPNVRASLPVPGSPVLPGRGEDLIAAGLLMLAGHVDLDELDHLDPSGLGTLPGTPVGETSDVMTENYDIEDDELSSTAAQVSRPDGS